MPDTAFPGGLDADFDLFGGRTAADLRTGHANGHDLAASAIRAIEDFLIDGAASPLSRSWRPASLIGTYGSGTTYAYGDAVRALDGSDWKLYISLVAGNLAHNPVGDATGSWQDTVAGGKPVIVEGTDDTNTFGVQNLIIHYTNNATGGTFDLGDALLLAWDAAQADIQTAIDGAYATGLYNVTGDAADFTVESYGGDLIDAAPAGLVIDGANLTGGTASQSTTQAGVTGGFLAPIGTMYAFVDGTTPTYTQFNGVVDRWVGIWNGGQVTGATEFTTPLTLDQGAFINSVNHPFTVTDTGATILSVTSNGTAANDRLLLFDGSGLERGARLGLDLINDPTATLELPAEVVIAPTAAEFNALLGVVRSLCDSLIVAGFAIDAT